LPPLPLLRDFLGLPRSRDCLSPSLFRQVSDGLSGRSQRPPGCGSPQSTVIMGTSQDGTFSIAATGVQGRRKVLERGTPLPARSRREVRGPASGPSSLPFESSRERDGPVSRDALLRMPAEAPRRPDAATTRRRCRGGAAGSLGTRNGRAVGTL